MNLVEFTILDDDSPTVPEAHEIKLNTEKIILVEPKNDQRTRLRLDTSGVMNTIEVEGDYKETLKKLN